MAALMKLSSFFRPWPSLLTRHVNRFKDNSTVTKVINRTKFSTKAAWEMDTNVAKDVVLYAHHNPQFHKCTSPKTRIRFKSPMVSFNKLRRRKI
ncbi:Transmembrane protein 223 [Daphnia magna]|uniref:Transmembrane protein 223 n=1 Tax=Daphnia magna TaxID=35525 RepID=A0A164JIM9_9CRUS|nr:Transmembrane protein 223 [Daphnia magna]